DPRRHPPQPALRHLGGLLPPRAGAVLLARGDRVRLRGRSGRRLGPALGRRTHRDRPLRGHPRQRHPHPSRGHLRHHGAAGDRRDPAPPPGPEESYTFHGRDIYAFTGARLAAGVASFEEVGRELPLEDMVRLPLTAPEIADGTVRGIIDTLDVRYGSLWTSIPRTLFGELGVADGDRVMVRVLH